VRTQKVEFLTLRDADMSRTRLIDAALGYQWDRTVVYLRSRDLFVVVDGITILRDDYFTFTNFWHGKQILARGNHWYDIATDSLPGFSFPRQRSLLVLFPEHQVKVDSTETISRHGQMEQAIYQTASSQYRAGTSEVFVTVLVPHDRSVAPSTIVPSASLLPVSTPGGAVGLAIKGTSDTALVCVKIDLESEVARENIRPRYQYDLGKVRYGNVETDAHFLYGTVRGSHVTYAAANVLRVLYGGVTLMEALPNTHPLQLDGWPDRVGFTKWRVWEGTTDIERKIERK
jgi:hypothetical protein